MNYEILVNKENPINMEYMKDIIGPSLVEIEFTRTNDDYLDIQISNTLPSQPLANLG
ncbi:MAG: hypothetical protein J6B64_02020 [Bacilli bacterium]|nr:hypothetical protein [Bacilli bacterium]MBP3921333.1 hypothetical protein [Bacilli bacterium]